MLNKVNYYIIIYFSIALLLAPIHVLSLDTYYYWDWSRHLALSYYDGSPMIAYFIKISTLLFGDTLLALNMVSLVGLGITTYIVYQSARLCLNKEASYVAMLLWLFSPLVTLDLLNEATYDIPLTLFWALTLYFSLHYIKNNKIQTLYYIGLSIGLMLLSKYSGVVLVLGLFVFLVTTPLRVLLKSYHLYLALVLALLIFAPVILWNYQHDWLSFHYQLNSHQLAPEKNPLVVSALGAFFSVFLPSLNFLLLAPVAYWHHFPRDKSQGLYLCLVVSVVFFCFYAFIGCKSQIRSFWLAPYLISSSLLAGYCFQALKYRKSIVSVIILYAVISLCTLLSGIPQLNITNSKKIAYYQWMQAFNKQSPTQPDIIVTTGWYESRMLFFLKNKPTIYTLDCGSRQNQYALWSIDFANAVFLKKIKHMLYIDIFDRHECMEKYFDNCTPVAFPTSISQDRRSPVFAYNCYN